MKVSSFEDAKLTLDEACEYLRSFTLGRHGFTQRNGIEGIQRVVDHCHRMERLFGRGPDAEKSKKMVTSAGFRVTAAQARLALLRKSR